MTKGEKLLTEARGLNIEATEHHVNGKLQDACVAFQGACDYYEQSHTELRKELMGDVSRVVEIAIEETKPFWGEKIIYKHEAFKSVKSALKKLEVKG